MNEGIGQQKRMKRVKISHYPTAAATSASDDLLTSDDLWQFELEGDEAKPDGVEELEELSAVEKEELLEQTQGICTVIKKVCVTFFKVPPSQLTSSFIRYGHYHSQ